MKEISIRYCVLVVLMALLFSLSGCATVSEKKTKTEIEQEISQEFRFVFTGDSRGNYKANPPVHLASEILEKVSGHIVALDPKPEFVIFNGDMVAKTAFSKAPEAADQWRDIFEKPLKNAGIKLFITPGNHVLDQKKPCAVDDICYVPRFNKYFQADNPLNGPLGYEGVTYSFTRANTHFATVTSFATHNGPDNEIQPSEFVQQKKNFDYYVNKVNRKWLAEDLKQDESAFTVFFTHAPLYPVGPHNTDMKSLHAYPAKRDELAGILAKNNVDIVISSHEHLYARSNIGHDNPTSYKGRYVLPQVIAGSASAPLSYTPPRPDMKFEKYIISYNYMVADVKKDRIEFRIYDETAKQIDSFILTARQEN